MNTLLRSLAIATLAGGMLAAQAHPRDEPGPPARCQAETAGRVIGGIAGALIGRELGDDRAGRTIGTVGGAFIGSVIGGELGRRVDADDPSCSAAPAPGPRGRSAGPRSGV